MTPKVAIIYYSATGTTFRLAQAVEAGAKEAGRGNEIVKGSRTRPGRSRSVEHGMGGAPA